MKCNLFSLALWGVVALVCGCASTPAPQGKAKHLEMATLWFQTSAENRALQYQAYSLAKMILDKDLQKKAKKKDLPRAVIVDIDETVLDNVPFQASLLLEDQEFPGRWADWIAKAEAKPISGAVEFLKYAHSKGVKVFYLTNRSDKYKPDTIKNLSSQGFPEVNEKSVITASNGEWSKEGRREKIRAEHRVVLLVGDNLNDFNPDYEKKGVAERFQALEGQKDRFGTAYVIIPNPMYGDWEGALYNHDYKLPAEKKQELRRSNLKSF